MTDSLLGGAGGAHRVRLAGVPLLPELRLYLAEDPVGLWELAGGGYRSDTPPPFWAFAWAGGQALARYVLDHPDTVAGARVLDLAAGCGVVGIAAARAGAAVVRAVDVDPAAIAAITRNAQVNAVPVHAVRADVLDGPAGEVDVVLAGDACYSAALSGRVAGFLRRAARAGVRVLVGDPDRGFLRSAGLHALAHYDVAVPVALEDVAVRRATIWQWPAGMVTGRPARPGPGRPATGPDGVAGQAVPDSSA